MSQEAGGHGHYYVPPPSTYPITGSIALLFMGFGAAFSVNKIPWAMDCWGLVFHTHLHDFCLVSRGCPGK